MLPSPTADSKHLRVTNKNYLPVYKFTQTAHMTKTAKMIIHCSFKSFAISYHNQLQQRHHLSFPSLLTKDKVLTAALIHAQTVLLDLKQLRAIELSWTSSTSGIYLKLVQELKHKASNVQTVFKAKQLYKKVNALYFWLNFLEVFVIPVKTLIFKVLRTANLCKLTDLVEYPRLGLVKVCFHSANALAVGRIQLCL